MIYHFENLQELLNDESQLPRMGTWMLIFALGIGGVIVLVIQLGLWLPPAAVVGSSVAQADLGGGQ